jgi:hypothetical protein
VRATGVSRRFACGFRTDLHFADAGRNALLGSDTLLKLTHLSLHSISSQIFLEASSD